MLPSLHGTDVRRRDYAGEAGVSSGGQAERIAYRRRPLGDIDAVMPEEREGQTLESESDAGAMRDAHVAIPDTPEETEMIDVVIEAHARSRYGLDLDGNLQFEFEVVFALVACDDAAAPPEERVIAMLACSYGETPRLATAFNSLIERSLYG